ncbi:hypothetical protein ABIA06_003286 [Bradyrhizobium yuanmingense]|uniref:DUF4429 domain-containing protein n=1 Tax=Bradyrhizobium yuanmingense TaxID=108015 RepID=UPI003515CC28
MLCKGIWGSLELLEDRLIIRRSTIMGTLSHGLKGAKSIPYSAISAVQFKRSGLTSGYIQFTMGGSNESAKGLWDATADENTMMFTNNEVFEKAREFIESRMGVRPVAPQMIATESVADSLEKLAALRDRGILTAEEFEDQKAKALGRSFGASAAAPIRSPEAEVQEQPSEAKSRMMAAMDRAIQQRSVIAAPAGGPTFGRRTQP